VIAHLSFVLPLSGYAIGTSDVHSEDVIAGIALILALGMAAQWLAHRFHVPSILFLLGAGLLVGPATGILSPEEMFGDVLFPIVSVSVAIILYEGGLDLRIRELRAIGPALLRLISLGALVTWLVTTLAARFILGLNYDVAILLGAILIVSGPTVVIPLLLHIRPARRVGNMLKWEGIFIDPIGAILAVIVLQAIVAGDLRDDGYGWDAASDVAATFLVGGIIGALAAIGVTYILKHYLVPDLYQNMLSLAVVVGIFALSNEARAESGLFAVTIMGLVLANQPYVSVRRIVDFKENLRVLIISSLFIVLAARLERDEITPVLTFGSLAFLLILILVARPLATLISTWRSPLTWNDRAFIAWMAPRGIVAAAVASIFGIELSEAGVENAALLTPYVFLTIIGTVLVYGLTAPNLARRLKLASTGPSGTLILGAHPLAQELGLVLLEEGFPVLLVDSNRTNVQGARLAGLRTYYGNILSDDTIEELDLSGIDTFIAMTPNDEVNALAAVRMGEIFERRNVYQVAPQRVVAGPGERSTSPRHLRGRILGSPEMTFQSLSSRLRGGASVKRTVLTQRFTYTDFERQYESPLPLFIVDRNHVLRPIAEDQEYVPAPGDKIIALVDDQGVQVRTTLQVSPERVLTAAEMEAAGLVSSFCHWEARTAPTRERAGRIPRQPTPLARD
jgi:NhaP-type Na+/H+ or K+/H+ antiporter